MQKRGRILWVFLAAAVIALLALGYAARTYLRPDQSAIAKNKAIVRLAIPSNGAAFWPTYVADKQGFYAAQGLEVRRSVVDPNITVSSLIGGAMDIAFADSTQLLFALEKHADLVVVGLSADRQPYRLMTAPSITTLAGLKGKKIGVASEIDVYTYVLKTILRGAGLNPDKDVVWVVGGNQQRRLAAMTGGNIDAGFFSPPSDSRLRKAGFNGLAFAPDYVPHLMLSTQVVRRTWTQSNGDVLRRLLHAQTAAVQWLYDPKNKQEAIAILVEQTGAKPDDAQEAYEYFVAPHAWQDGCVHEEGLFSVIRIMRETHQLTSITESDVPKFADGEWCAG